jgi:hypothetical protein
VSLHGFNVDLVFDGEPASWVADVGERGRSMHGQGPVSFDRFLGNT